MSLTRFRSRSSEGVALVLALGLTPLAALAQDVGGAGTGAVYESATTGYRGLDAPPDSELPIGAPDSTQITGVPDRAPVPASSDSDAAPPPIGAALPDAKAPPGVEVAPVPAPIAKLQESTDARRGTDPDEAPAGQPAPRQPAFEYESAFDAYRMFEESEGPDWVGANGKVGEIGGWKTYAREMYESASGDALNDDAESGEGEDR